LKLGAVGAGQRRGETDVFDQSRAVDAKLGLGQFAGGEPPRRRRELGALVERLANGPPPLAAFLLIAACYGAYVLAVGVTIAPDSLSYDYWAGRLIASGFDYPTVVGQASARFPALLYTGFVSLVALLQLLFGDRWLSALVVLNVCAGAALGAQIVGLAKKAAGSGAGGWAALGLILACGDLVQWIAFPLSDPIFACLAFTIFNLAAARILGTARRWHGIFALAAIGVFFRPTGMVLLPDLGWAAYLARRGLRPVAAVRLAVVTVAGVAAGVFLFAWLMQDPTRWPFTTLASTFHAVAADYALGEVVNARVETYHAAPATLIQFVLVSADRFVHYFTPAAAGFSAAHQARQLLFFLPAYGLASWLLLQLARGRDGLALGQRRVFAAAAGAILAYAVFHGLVQVDFDWRYRLPILPHLILLAAGGAADLVRRARRR
jgi:hypothetical protein